MAKIGRSFEQLNLQIKETQKQISAASKEIAGFDKQLKLNPGNVDVVRQKYQAMERQVQLNAKKTALFKEKQQELKKQYEDGSLTETQYNSRLAATTKKLDEAEKEAKELAAALKNQNKEIRNAKLEQFSQGLDKAKEKTEKLSKAVLIGVGAVTALMAASINMGDELNDTATKYSTSVENLQIWSNRLGLLGGDQEAYTKSLAAVGSMMSSITAGRGKKYLTYLQQLGIAQADIKNKTNAEVFDLIFSKLQQVSDGTQQAIIAQGLLGDTGLEIATIAGTEVEALNDLDQAFISNGIITTEQANAADTAANTLLGLKQQSSAASAEVLVALMPAFNTLVGIIKDDLIPIITKAADWFKSLGSGGQKAVLMLLGMIIVLPKVIGFVKGFIGVMQFLKAATNAQTASTAALNTVSTPWLGIIMAVSMALMALISLLGFFLPGGGVNDVIYNANSMLDSIDGLSEEMDKMDADVKASAQASIDSNTNKNLNIKVDVNATGDTPISRDNAELVSDELHKQIEIDLLNNGLGEIIR